MKNNRNNYNAPVLNKEDKYQLLNIAELNKKAKKEIKTEFTKELNILGNTVSYEDKNTEIKYNFTDKVFQLKKILERVNKFIENPIIGAYESKYNFNDDIYIIFESIIGGCPIQLGISEFPAETAFKITIRLITIFDNNAFKTDILIDKETHQIIYLEINDFKKILKYLDCYISEIEKMQETVKRFIVTVGSGEISKENYNFLKNNTHYKALISFGEEREIKKRDTKKSRFNH